MDANKINVMNAELQHVFFGENKVDSFKIQID